MRRPKVTHSEITARRLRRRRATIGTTVRQQTNTPRSQRRRGSRNGGRASVPTSLPITCCHHSATMMGDMAVGQSFTHASQSGQTSALVTVRDDSSSNSVASGRQTTSSASRSRKEHSTSHQTGRRRCSCPEPQTSRARPVKRARARSTNSRVALTKGRRSKLPRLSGGLSTTTTSSEAGHNSSELGSPAAAMATGGTGLGSSLEAGRRGHIGWGSTQLEVSQNQCCSALLSRPEVAPFTFTIKGKRRADSLPITSRDDARESSEPGSENQSALLARFPAAASGAHTLGTVDTPSGVSSYSVPSNLDIGVPSSWAVFSQFKREEVEKLVPTGSSQCDLDLLNSDSDEEDEGDIDLYQDEDENDGNNNNDAENNIKDHVNNSNVGDASYQLETEDNDDLFSLPSYSAPEDDSIS